MEEQKLRRILAGHMRTLMAKRPDLETQEKLAKACGIAQTTVGRILNAKVAATLDNIEAMAGAFGVPAAALLADEGAFSMLQLRGSSISKLPDGDKSRIAAFIAFTLQESAARDSPRLSFADERAPENEEARRAAKRAASRPLTQSEGVRIDDTEAQTTRLSGTKGSKAPRRKR